MILVPKSSGHRPLTGRSPLSYLALSLSFLAHVQSAHASESDSITGSKNGERIRDMIHEVDWGGGGGSAILIEAVSILGLGGGKQPEVEPAAHLQYDTAFPNLALDKSALGERQLGFLNLPNNIPEKLNISPGETVYYVVQNETVWGPPGTAGVGLPSPIDRRRDVGDSPDEAHTELRRRQTSTKTVWLSMNTCQQPTTNQTLSAAPPQLTMYVSTSDGNQKPGPDVTSEEQEVIALVEGFASVAIQADKNVYVGVSAPSLPDTFTGPWNYQIAASIDAPFFESQDNSFLGIVDTDTTSALLVTGNLTSTGADQKLKDKWLSADTPFTIFTYAANTTQVDGVRNSFCGLDLAKKDALEVTMGMTDRGEDDIPRQQFHVKGLQGGTTYHGLLAIEGNSTAFGPGVVGGGGRVWRPVKFSTKSDSNCALIFSLPFCSSIAYAAPSNPTLFADHSQLAALYDNRAQALYKNFNRSLQQIPCNTTDTAKYSLARTCDDCARDYKDWLCAVSIPRCTDFSLAVPPSDALSVRPRNIAAPYYNGSEPPDVERLGWDLSWRERRFANSSRNAWIDETIRPGPYKEVLPCSESCWDVVRSCPASLGFKCPEDGIGVEWGYGEEPVCNRVGVYDIDGSRGAAGRLGVDIRWTWTVVGMYLFIWLWL